MRGQPVAHGVAYLSRTVLLASVLFVTSSCETASPDLESLLPSSVGGHSIEYLRSNGFELQKTDPSTPELTIPQSLGFPVESMTVMTGSLERIGYRSRVIWVPGSGANRLLQATLLAYGFTGETRMDLIGGKRVLRALPPFDGPSNLDIAPYLYAFNDAVISIIAERPQDAEEALRRLP